MIKCIHKFLIEDTMKLSTRSKTIIAVLMFVVVFTALILVATFFDFQVSQILTKNALPEGEYYADDFFGVLFECIGSIPIYLFAAFVCCVVFWVCLKVWKKKPYNVIVAIIFAVGSVVAFTIAVSDALGYIFDHVFARLNPNDFESVDELYHSLSVGGVEVAFGILLSALALLATKHFNEDTLKKLFKVCITATVAVVVANVLIMIVKGPVGRMRFRAINTALGEGYIASGDVAGYTRWYIANGQPSDKVLKAFELRYAVTDAFKSFPSGHTCAAATTYMLILLPDVIDFKHKKGAKIACWIIPIAFTMLVAISRIVVGAHYMSDVTMGGTLAFVCMMIAREVFICKGSHFFAVFPKLQRKRALAQEEQASLQDDASTGVSEVVSDPIEETVDCACIDSLQSSKEPDCVCSPSEQNSADCACENTAQNESPVDSVCSNSEHNDACDRT